MSSQNAFRHECSAEPVGDLFVTGRNVILNNNLGMWEQLNADDFKREGAVRMVIEKMLYHRVSHKVETRDTAPNSACVFPNEFQYKRCKEAVRIKENCTFAVFSSLSLSILVMSCGFLSASFAG